jgi:hypothetical protein
MARNGLGASLVRFQSKAFGMDPPREFAFPVHATQALA